MNSSLRNAVVIFGCLVLVGCESTAPTNMQVDKYKAEASEVAKYSDLQLCQKDDGLQASLNVNPSSHPEYNENLRKSKVIQQKITFRNISCYKVKAANAAPVKPLSPQKKKRQVSVVCESYAQRSQFADPSVLFEMCVRGYNSTLKKCSDNLSSFNTEARAIPRPARAEYIEVGNAFRMGCNLK